MFNLHFYSPAYLIFLSLLNFSLIAQEMATDNYTADYPEAVNYLFSLKTTGESADVSSEIILNKDVGSFKLQEGTLYQCSDYNGIPYALVFIGKGEFSFTPPSEIEKKQLYRFYETENFQMNFKELFLLFDDNTCDEIFSNLRLQKANTNRVDDEIEDCEEYFKDGNIGDSRSDFLRSIMVEGRNGFFYAQIQESKFDPVFFQINPYEFEEVSFMNDRKGGALLGSDKVREIINLFPAMKETLEPYSVKKPNKYFLDLIAYKIESTISDNLDFSAKCIMDFESNEKEQRWIMFYLYDELLVDSVKWDDGSTARFINAEESSELWIRCRSDYLDGNQHSMIIYYQGDLLEKNDLGWIYLKSSIYWYPRYDNREKAAFGFIFHTPSKYDFVSIGDLVGRVEKEDVITTKWFCKSPIRNASFNIGNFEKYNVSKENLPEVNVYISKSGHHQISQNLVKYGVLSMSDASEYIAQDISNSIELFTALFGKPPINSIRVTETPYLHGEAFPGLVDLSWATVVQTNFEGEDEIFRAHEAAHQ
ncbi:MAG: hypothetical protein OQK52_04515 [Ignavibacteriaceae bacterium]|nr:hypothetical protein [Ignavibacteriaceae bacterium]MCW8817125.1 hypothetical protein [Ignavibacteriaceae bacterium]MCW8960335.1 hypothetical protein [Ignavibacteriaceae bacterium]MCW8994744.1 hypothetical protein [Psychromonas sp.]MCW9094660.1 hypothetical protein [Ignavibacteriaceae bacterium]